MFNSHKRLTAIMLAVLVGVSAGGVAVKAGQSETSPDADPDPVRCEIVSSTSNGATTLQSVFHSDEAVSGTYLFKMLKASHSGTSNIQQGGSFVAGADDRITLGRVILGGLGATYEISLSVQTGGKTYECSERFGDIA